MNRDARRRARARSNTQTTIEALFAGRIPGGCDDCDAYQELTAASPGVYVLAIRHDPSCPYLQGVTS